MFSAFILLPQQIEVYTDRRTLVESPVIHAGSLDSSFWGVPSATDGMKVQLAISNRRYNYIYTILGLRGGCTSIVLL